MTRLLELSALAALFIIPVVACTGSETPTFLGDTPLTEDVAERLITKTEIQAAGGNVGGLNQSVEDLLEIASSIDPTLPTMIEALWSVRWTASGRPGALMTLTRFREAPRAHGALENRQWVPPPQHRFARITTTATKCQGQDCANGEV